MNVRHSISIFFCFYMTSSLGMEQAIAKCTPGQTAAPTNQSNQPEKIVLVELRSTFEMQFPATMNSIIKSIAALYTNPRQAEKDFFKELRTTEEPCQNPVSHYYPQIVQQWLTDNLATAQARTQLLAKGSWVTPLYNTKVETTFSEGTCAQALVPHTPTIDLLALCTAQRFLCADFNGAEFKKLQEKYPEILGERGAFPPAQTHISGAIGYLMCQKEFWNAMCTPENRTHAIFIGNNPEACTAAQDAGITSVHYTCANDSALGELRKLLREKDILPQDTP